MNRHLKIEESGAFVFLDINCYDPIDFGLSIEFKVWRNKSINVQVSIGYPLARTLHLFWSILVGALDLFGSPLEASEHRFLGIGLWGIGLWASASGAYWKGIRNHWNVESWIACWFPCWQSTRDQFETFSLDLNCPISKSKREASDIVSLKEKLWTYSLELNYLFPYSGNSMETIELFCFELNCPVPY